MNGGEYYYPYPQAGEAGPNVALRHQQRIMYVDLGVYMLYICHLSDTQNARNTSHVSLCCVEPRRPRINAIAQRFSVMSMCGCPLDPLPRLFRGKN